MSLRTFTWVRIMVTMGVGSASLLVGSFMLVSQSHICTCQGDTYVCGINDRWGGGKKGRRRT
jgi:hypothetical protein